jgi:serine/threonine-protein kinase
MVALKFLPATAGGNQAALERFYSEVRIARQVSHPNVCRVYDIGETGGQPYLSMEYIDGENLSSLLRRIGRLPEDKGIEMARRLCAGLAAAHSKGVLHRDFKPANIMIDNAGQTLITDFGLAGFAGTLTGAEVRNGTPAYMAPEQLSGREVSVHSDVYALGLVLYEIFTGRQAFQAESLAELTRVREETGPEDPRSVVRDLDPALARVILRCLEPAPENRPPSALSVAAALPGGDPLAAALEAGETPSPELLASAGISRGMNPVVAFACMSAIMFGLGLTFFLNQRIGLVNAANVERSPEALRDAARQAIAEFGYDPKQFDSASGFMYDVDALTSLRSKTPKTKPADTIRFWYRTSPRTLTPLSLGPTFEDVSYNDPPQTISRMVTVTLNPQGQVDEFVAVPPQVDETAPMPAEAQWAKAFNAAGLAVADFTETSPKWLPPVMADARKAWVPSGGATAPGFRLEAAAWRGKIVYFRKIWPWSHPERMDRTKPPESTELVIYAAVAFLCTVLVSAGWMAWRNLHMGRGDQRGAFRLAFGMFCVFLASWAVGGKFFADAGEFGVFINAVGRCLYLTSFLWLCYVALEPYVRRRWPRVLVSWARVLDGRFQDPVVGAHLLAGVAVGLVLSVLSVSDTLIQKSLGAQDWLISSLDPLMGARQVVRVILLLVGFSVLQSLAIFFVLFLLRVVLRKEWLAVAVFTLIFALLVAASTTNFALGLVFGFAANLLLVMATLRFGLVTMVSGLCVAGVLTSLPLTNDANAFYFDVSVIAVLSVAALAFYAFYIAKAGQPIFKKSFLDS